MFHVNEPFSAIRNAKEIANALIVKCGERDNVPPMLPVYTDGGPKHRSNFLSVQIAMIALQLFLDLDILIATRTSPGHSCISPPEKINFIFNLGLNAIELMWTAIHSNPGFEKHLFNFSEVDDIRNVLKRNPRVHANLLNSHVLIALAL